ncbi:hypothetical protein Acsp02_59770 [Actinoplanes sp. NBRC 103695]|nr:hypothetical protein Acsp02_59770 [Actinoplanes sp. NBRC 103695]
MPAPTTRARSYHPCPLLPPVPAPTTRARSYHPCPLLPPVPAPTTRARSYHRPRPATAASGGSDSEWAPGGLADPAEPRAGREWR